MPKIYNSERIKQRALVTLQATKILNIPVIATEQYPQGIGKTVPDLRDIIKDVDFVEKIHFNCFNNMEFLEKLKRINRKNLLVSGIEAHICITQTVLEALRRNYVVYLIEDTISSRSSEDREIALRRLELAGAIPSSVEMILYELLVKSGTSEFKQILKLVK
jgi:isochorismate hydrolase